MYSFNCGEVLIPVEMAASSDETFVSVWGDLERAALYSAWEYLRAMEDARRLLDVLSTRRDASVRVVVENIVDGDDDVGDGLANVCDSDDDGKKTPA